MYAEEDVVVVIVADKEDGNLDSKSIKPLVPKSEPECSTNSTQVDDLIEAAQKHGEYISIKTEVLESPKAEQDDYEYEYLEDDLLQKSIKSEGSDDDDADSCNSEMDNLKPNARSKPEKHRHKMLKPGQQKSFVAKLRNQYSHLKDDEDSLVIILKQIMKTVKPPPPPENYCVMIKSSMYECTRCGAHTISEAAAGRHYQKLHGTRYLVCYACGVDFRSTANLYIHEKRCTAPDAQVVLRARGAYLGRKGRSRPFMQQTTFTLKPDSPTAFDCRQCSAVFRTAVGLEAHENLHRGERPYRCHACPAAYTSSRALLRHELNHTDAQFICDHCNRSFKLKAALVTHLNIHNPIRKYGCVKCDRRFAGKSSLVLHIRREHLGLPPPFACQICPRRFPRMSLLKVHMEKTHGLTIITQKKFHKSLPTMSESELRGYQTGAQS